MSNPSSTTEGVATGRILLVDDDPIFAMIAQEHLATAGFESVVATDGVMALEAIDAEHFDLALIDLSMPRIDGFRLIGLIRGARRHRRLAIVVVTSRQDPQAWNEALSLGANGFQSKPVDWATFPERIEGLIAQIRLRGDAIGVVG